jgi:hypothetical protein
MADDDDDLDDEEIWENICRIAGKKAGISTEKAKAVLERAGFHAYGHTGIVEAVNVVLHSVGKPALTPD